MKPSGHYSFFVRLLLAFGVSLFLSSCHSYFKTSLESFDSQSNNSDGSTLDGNSLVYDGNVLSLKFNATCAKKSTGDFMDSLTRGAGRIYPEDCAYSGTNPPVIQWTENNTVNEAVPWTITISKNGTTYLTGQNIYPHFQVPNALPAGDYEWSVSFTNKSGQVVTSAKRHFTINANSFATTLPTPSTVVDIAKNKQHPRIIPTGVNKATLVARQSPTLYSRLVQKAAALKNEAIPAQPVMRYRSEFSSDLEYNQWVQSLMHTAENETIAISYMGYSSYLNDDATVKAAAINRLISLAAWDPNGPTSYSFQDQANRTIMLGLAQGYDLLYNDLSAGQRTTVINAFKNRVQQMIPLISKIHYFKSDSHGTTNTGYFVNALILIAGDTSFPEAETYLHNAYNTFVANMNIFGGDDGAFGNGDGYGWYYQTLFDAALSIQFVTGYRLNVPYLNNIGKYLIAITAPLKNQLFTPFGDGHSYLSYYGDYSIGFQSYALWSGSAEYEWYWQAYEPNKTNTGVRPIFYYNLVGSGLTQVAAAAPTQNSSVFSDAGLAILTSEISNPLRSSVAFRSSQFGAFNHSEASQNSFTVVSKGQDMLISSGYYPYYNSPHHKNIARSTRYHNALTFDGGIGQAESTANPTMPTAPHMSTEASGQIINAGDKNGMTFVTGDATKAYRGSSNSTSSTNAMVWNPLLTNAVRTLTYFRDEKIIVVYDWATSDTARQWELNYHALKPFAINGSAASVTNGGSSICISHANFSATLTASEGFEIAPEATYAQQYHLRATATAKSKELVAIAIIKEDCSNQAVQVNIDGTNAKITIGNKAIKFDKKTVSLLSK